MIRSLRDVIKEQNIPYRESVSAKTLSTFRIGGIAPLVIEPQCANELINAVRLAYTHRVPFAVIGRGSNVLFGDESIQTVLIRTCAVDGVRHTKNGAIADCGVPIAGLSLATARRGFADLCFACGIPGTLGGTLLMNAGAHGHSISELVRSVEVYLYEKDDIETWFNEQLNYSYRNSIFQTVKAVILSAELVFQESAETEEILSKISALRTERALTQPTDQPSAGSVFKRTEEHVPLSRILDELGLKGLRVGGASVSQKHAGFIVNDSNATAKDVKELIRLIQNIVEKERGIQPKPELRFIPTDT